MAVMAPMWVILGVDPGETTGMVVAALYKEMSPGKPPPQGVTLYTHPMIQGHRIQVIRWGQSHYDSAPQALKLYAREAHRLTATLNIPTSRVAVVVEDFVITRTAMMGNATWSSEITGVAKTIATLEAPAHYWDNTQKSAEMKTAILKTKVMQKMGLIKRGDKISSHMADAMGHAILFAARYRNGEFTPR